MSPLGLTSIIRYRTYLRHVHTSERNDHWAKGRMPDDPTVIYLFSVGLLSNPS